jgi:hypothetical protein
MENRKFRILFLVVILMLAVAPALGNTFKEYTYNGTSAPYEWEKPVNGMVNNSLYFEVLGSGGGEGQDGSSGGNGGFVSGNINTSQIHSLELYAATGGGYFDHTSGEPGYGGWGLASGENGNDNGDGGGGGMSAIVNPADDVLAAAGGGGGGTGSTYLVTNQGGRGGNETLGGVSPEGEVGPGGNGTALAVSEAWNVTTEEGGGASGGSGGDSVGDPAGNGTDSTIILEYEINNYSIIESLKAYNNTNYQEMEATQQLKPGDGLTVRSNITDPNNNIETAKIVLRDPNGDLKAENLSMSNKSFVEIDGNPGATFEFNYSFSENSEIGDWTYTVWVEDGAGLTNSSSRTFSVFIPASLETSFNTENLDLGIREKFKLFANISCESDKSGATCLEVGSNLRSAEFDFEPASIIKSVEGYTPFRIDSIFDGKDTKIETVKDRLSLNEGNYNSTYSDTREGQDSVIIGHPNGTLADQTDGYYRFDREPSGSGGTVIDYSAQNVDGSTNNGVNTGVKGVFGTTAYGFDGNNAFVEIPDSGDNLAFDWRNSFTVSMWLKPDKTTGDLVILSKEETGSDLEHGGLELTLNSSELRVVANNENLNVPAERTLPKNEWSHIAVAAKQHNSTYFNATIYVNGTWANSGLGEITRHDYPGSSVLIGRRGLQNDRNYNGTLDELRYNTGFLSEEAVEKLYFYGADGEFNGDYQSKTFEQEKKRNWTVLQVKSNLPDGTELTAHFKSLNSDSQILDSKIIEIKDGVENYTVNVENSTHAEILFNGTSSDPEKTWRLSSFSLFREMKQNTNTCPNELSRGEECSLTWNVTPTEAGSYNIDANFSSTASFIESVDTENKRIDTAVTPPTWKNQKQSTEFTTVSSTVNLSAEGRDNFNLSRSFLATNETGEWENKTGIYGSPVENIFSEEKWTLTSFQWGNGSIKEQKVIGWRIWFEDIYGNKNSTKTKTFTVRPNLWINETQPTSLTMETVSNERELNGIRSFKPSISTGLTNARTGNLGRIFSETFENPAMNLRSLSGYRSIESIVEAETDLPRNLENFRTQITALSSFDSSSRLSDGFRGLKQKLDLESQTERSTGTERLITASFSSVDFTGTLSTHSRLTSSEFYLGATETSSGTFSRAVSDSTILSSEEIGLEDLNRLLRVETSFRSQEFQKPLSRGLSRSN